MKWWNRTQPKPVLFELHRERDLKEISGTGHVLDGVIFPNGVTVIQWRKKQKQSVAVFQTFKQFEGVHMKHHIGTQLKWVEGFDGIGFATRYLNDVSRELAVMRNKAPVDQKEAYGKAAHMIGAKAGLLMKKSAGITIEEGQDEKSHTETKQVQVPGEATA